VTRAVHRRAVLLGLGGGLAATALPRRLLSDVLPPPRPPRRLVLVMQNNGTQQGNFWPAPPAPGGPDDAAAKLTSPILEPLLADPRIAAKTAAVRGVFIPRDTNGTNGNEHDMGFARMFTGAKLMSVGDQPWGGAPSVDQIVARAWGVDTLTLAILTSSIEPNPKPGFDHRRSFSYLGPAQHKLPTLNPYDAYMRVFGDAGAPADEASRRRLLLRQSALDAAMGNLRDVRAKLGRAERAKLDVHLASVRDLEVRIGRSLAGGISPGAACARKPDAPSDTGKLAPDLLVNDESAIPELATTMLDLIAASLGCGAMRVATLQLGFGGGKWRFAWEGIDRDLHRDVAHNDTSDAGSTPENTALLVRANHWYASQIAYLAKKLDAIPEGDGTVLDNTLIVWANEFGRGDHSLVNVPIVLVGGASPAAAGGGARVVDAGAQTFQRVGCTILRAMGIAADGFGDEPACGPLQGL